MSFLEWDETLSIHVDAMDSEHKELIKLMNKLHDEHEANANKVILTQSLLDLKNYTVKHFTDEEAYMESIQYTGLETHQYIHKDLLKKLGEHEKDFLTSGKLSDSFFSFLKLWLVSHIKGIDTKYAKEVKQSI